MKPSTPNPPPLPLKRWPYYAIALAIPVVLFVLLEFSLRVFNYGFDLHLFKKSTDYAGYYEVNQDVAKRFFTKYNGTEPSNDIFLIQKPDTCYRVFVMGCSTARGFPYKMGVTFSRILYYRLQDAFPHKRIEIVNTAMAAINSYAQADFIDEILAMHPDAILIYTGHNEFYGALGVGSVENGGNMRWIKRLHLALIKLRTYQMVQTCTEFVQHQFASDAALPKGTLMQRMAKEKAIVYQSDLYNAGIEQFRVNMGKVAEKIRNAGIPLIISDIISNIKGNAPFKSVQTDKYRRADSVFCYAQKLEKEGRFDEARNAYYLAKDLDCIRFRAPEGLNTAIYNIGATYHVPILEMKKVFEQHSPHAIVGNNLMTEHLHPNVEGQFLMADAFFNAMRQHHFIAQTWDTLHLQPSAYYRSHWGFTALDSLHADLTVKSLKASWPFKPENVENQFLYTYHPVSTEDSLALLCLRNTGIYIEDKHRELAEMYKSQGAFQQAYNEYYSLIKCYPYVYNLYASAAAYLSLNGNHTAALDVLRSFPNTMSNSEACTAIGKLYLKLNQPALAIAYLQQAVNLKQPTQNTEDLYVMLYKAYIQAGLTQKANATMSEIKEANPNFKPNDANTEKVVIMVDDGIKALLDEATTLMQQQRYDEALDVLYKSLSLKETTIANHFIGNLLLMKADSRALGYLEKAYKGDPKDANMLSNLCVAYITNKNFVMAAKILDEYKLVSPDNNRIQKLSLLLEKKRKQH